MTSPTEHTAVVPSVDANTHVLAVVGIRLVSADPDHDGWFLCDFYFFNQLLQGLGRSQSWITSVEPGIQINEYGEVTHGMQHKPRRMVLDKDQHPHNIVVVPENKMQAEVIRVLRDIVMSKWCNEDRILIFMFAHEATETFNLQIGFDPATNEPFCLSPADIEQTVASAVFEAQGHRWKKDFHQHCGLEPVHHRGRAYPQSGRLRSTVQSLAFDYLSSSPGPDTLASNVHAHHLVGTAAQGQLPREKFDTAHDLPL